VLCVPELLTLKKNPSIGKELSCILLPSFHEKSKHRFYIYMVFYAMNYSKILKFNTNFNAELLNFKFNSKTTNWCKTIGNNNPIWELV